MFRTIKSWLTADTTSRTQPKPQLGLTTLEAREVPAFLASWSAQDMVLRLTGTSGNDEAVVVQANGQVSVSGVTGIQVKVNGQTVGSTGALSPFQMVKVVADGYDGHDKVSVFTVPFNDSRDQSYHRPLSLTATGGRGNDTFKGDTFFVAKDVLSGESGDDRLEGGGGDDTLTGGAGQDQLVGGHGNDTLDGGGENDWLFGDYGTSMHPDTFRAYDTASAKRGGNDVLRGGAGYDHMWGEGGNDTLYGQGGDDRMYAGWGNDALFGGSHENTAYGEGGADRHLVWQPPLAEITHTTLGDFATEDAKIVFKDSPALQDQTFNGWSGTYDFAAGSWTEAEIVRFDVPLANLHAHTGNTRLLETATGQHMTFLRVGDALQPDSPGGWNSPDTHEIAVVGGQPDTADGNRWVARLVYHEFGHNWDETSEHRLVTDFRAVSGWVETDRPSAFQRPSGGFGDRWYYNASAANTFARDYGKLNPLEDMGTTWETYFLNEYHGGLVWTDGLTAVQDKWDVLDRMFVDLREPS